MLEKTPLNQIFTKTPEPTLAEKVGQAGSSFFEPPQPKKPLEDIFSKSKTPRADAALERIKKSGGNLDAAGKTASKIVDYGWKAFNKIISPATTVVGGAVGAAGGIIGGLTGVAAKLGTNLYQGKPTFKGVGEAAVKTGKATAQAGFHIGKTGTEFAAGIGAFELGGPAVAIPTGGAQVYTGMHQLFDPGAKEGDMVSGVLNVGLGTLGAFSGLKQKGFIKTEDPIHNSLFSDAIKEKAGPKVAETITKVKQAAAEKIYNMQNTVAENVLNLGKRDRQLEIEWNKDNSKMLVDNGLLKFVKKDENGFLDTTDMQTKAKELYQARFARFRKVLENSPHKFSLDEWAENAKNIVRNSPKAKADVDTPGKLAEIDSTLEYLKSPESYGTQGFTQVGGTDLAVSAPDFFDIKAARHQDSQWSMDKSNASRDASRAMATAAKTMMEKTFKKDKINIEGINKEIGNWINLVGSIKKANGGKVKGMGLEKWLLKGAAIMGTPGGLPGKIIANWTMGKVIDTLTNPETTAPILDKLYSDLGQTKEGVDLIKQAEQQIIKMKYPGYESAASAQKTLPAPGEVKALPKPPGAQPLNVLPAGTNNIELGGRQARTKTPAVIELPESKATLAKAVEQLKSGEVKAGEIKDTVVGLKEAQKQYVKDWLETTQPGYEFMAKQEVAGEGQQEAEVKINSEIVKAIKNTPYFRKEGSVEDFMGEGVIMTNPQTGRSVIASTIKNKDMISPAEEYFTKGYKQGMSVDSLAQEAGYDNGYDYLVDQLDMSAGSKVTKLEVAAHNELLKTDPNYKNLHDTVNKLDEELKTWKTEKVPLEQRRALLGNQQAFGAVAGVEPYKDKDGKWKVRFNAKKGVVGVGLMALGQSSAGREIASQIEELVGKKGVTTAEADAFKALLDKPGEYRAVGKEIGMTIAKLKSAEKTVLEKLGMTAEELKNKFMPPEPFKNFPDLSTKVLGKLEGRTTVSKQFISDLTNSGDLKQTERDIIREALLTEKSDKVNVEQFANKVKAELLPLKVKSSDLFKPDETKWQNPEAMISEGDFTPKYEGVSLPSDLRGNVSSYKENIYESPTITGAGDTHFPYTSKNYFGHTRVEDMAKNNTRRVIEVQSDLYQKGNLAKEGVGITTDPQKIKEMFPDPKDAKFVTEQGVARLKSLQKLQQYNDPTAHFRMAREEIKQAAADGKTKLQFPTGETAMKIEGLGENTMWLSKEGGGDAYKIDADWIKENGVGTEIYNEGDIMNGQESNVWTITKVLEDGKFKAVQKHIYDSFEQGDYSLEGVRQNTETFDISGKVDANNPIYKFYEKDLGKYLNKFGAKPVTDAQGVTWNEVPVSKDQAKMPVEAFGLLPIAGLGAAGAKQKDKKEPAPAVPKEYSKGIAKVYEKYPGLPKGTMEALLMAESSMGQNKANKKYDHGNYGYLVGFTKTAAEELRRNKISFDTSTPEGAIKAAAAYLNLKKDVRDASGKITKTYTDAIELYNERYNAGGSKTNSFEKWYKQFSQ